jgi:eukaryotic-like serine/threonine-protein kinase
MTALPAAHPLRGALCNFSLTAASPAQPRQGGPRRRRTQDSVDSHDTLIATPPTASVLDRYHLLERLGAGGFGVVWRAHDELLDREVAVKVIPLPAAGDRERATREALAAARLAHPAIVALYEACAEDDAFYLISELVHGDTLAQLIAREALCEEEVLEIGLALADALLHAHQRGVIHRDIKPQNVLVPYPAEESAAGDREPQSSAPLAKLTDFGGALLAGEEGLTRTGDVLGTLAYMAPEQLEGDQVGAPADLYSLALVLYEALSGVNPVRGPTPAATARRIGCELPPLERHRRGLPRELTRALDRALDPEPHERGTLPELREELAHALRDGLRRSPWQRRARSPQAVPAHSPQAAPVRPALAGAYAPARSQLRTARLGLDTAAGPPPQAAPAPAEPAQPDTGGWLTLPRLGWVVATLSVCVWQIAAARPGLALLACCAVLPLLLLVRRPGLQWLAAALAPLLGLAGLAGAFPALAGQPARWHSRALLGALGYWWLRLAELPLAGPAHGRLWLGAPAGTGAWGAYRLWERSLTVAAPHAILPLLGLGLLLGGALWAAAAALLPWIVRGRSALLDALAAVLWAAALAVGATLLDRGVAPAHAALPSPRGVILGAALAVPLAVAARALRGPV